MLTLQSSLNWQSFVKVFSSPSWMVFFSTHAMKECDGGQRKCWADAAEQPGFRIQSLLYIYCGRGRNTWLCRTYQARHSEERVFSKVTRFEEGRRRRHAQPTLNVFRNLHSLRTHTCTSCDVIWSPCEHWIQVCIRRTGYSAGGMSAGCEQECDYRDF